MGNVRLEVALDALTKALHARRPLPGLIHHTERGCRDTAARYQATLVQRGLVCSMSRSGDCLDSAMAENSFATLKADPIETPT